MPAQTPYEQQSTAIGFDSESLLITGLKAVAAGHQPSPAQLRSIAALGQALEDGTAEIVAQIGAFSSNPF